MNRLRRNVLSGLFLVSMAALPVSGAIIHNNGTPDGATAYISDLTDALQSQLLAENFTLPGPATALGVTWWGGYGLNTPSADSFTVLFYDDAGGEPGSVFYAENITPTRTLAGGQTGTSFDGAVDLYQYAADLSGVILSGSTSYWISIYNNSTTTGNRWVWASTSFNDGSVFALSPGDWNTLNVEFAFQLTDGAQVPEPSTMILCGAGLLGLLARRRHLTYKKS